MVVEEIIEGVILGADILLLGKNKEEDEGDL